jgi:hypothetical protein
VRSSLCICVSSQFDETPLHLAASLCEDRSEKVGGYLAVVKLLVAKGGNPALYDNVRASAVFSYASC